MPDCDSGPANYCSGWVIRELYVDKTLRYTELVTVMSIAGWEFTVCQLVVDGNPRVNLRGVPVTEYGRARLGQREISAVWEYRSGAWAVGDYGTGSQAIGGGLFLPATTDELVDMVANAPASWAHTDH
ncbi:hypothetical protein [Nocardia iowensis]|uniref:Uncharacterized protein n=1 Tax=Nocardia iowensis TaxID=204891 RepID=A0ABX8RL05_NOCIO|nr:hypothetical protein [Nocardia iowensis]QXN90284.1 hypothetical protein KV110_33470 [Nocardia iowensis]